MRTKLNGILTLFLALIVQMSFAQEKTISGNVTDQTGLPLPGVNIVVQGTTNGTQTDFDGNFSIQGEQGQVLLFTYIGQKMVQQAIGASSTMNVQMEEDAQALEEVVVTAQGIKREARALGYAVTTVKSDKLEQRAESDVARILSGKVAGVNITSSNGLSGSGTNIIIRGFSTATQSNQPLFVVDGVPYDSGTNGQSNFLDGATESSRFVDLDPNSIESLSVLKGLSATVLYGNRGRNGVILITTKNANSGNLTKKTEVSISQSIFQSKAILPKYQDNYGGGFHQGFGFFFSNWGSRFDRTDDDGIANAAQYLGRDAGNGHALLSHPFNFIGNQSLVAGYDDIKNTPYEYKPYNGVRDFFKTGTISTTSVNIRGGSEKVNYNVNYGRNEDIGITPGNRLLRNTFSMGGSAKLSNKITVSGIFNFTRTGYKSPPNAASFGSGSGFDGSAVFGDLLYTPRSVDLTNIPFQAADGRSVYYRSGNDIQNPYWTVRNAKATQNTDRFNGSVGVSFAVNDWSNLSYRLGMDTYTELNTYVQNKGGVDGEPTGILRTTAVRNSIWDHSFIWAAEKDLSENVNLKVNIGLNARRDTFERDGLESTGQLAFGVQKHFNFTTNSALNSFTGNAIAYSEDQNQLGVFVDATFGYKDFLYLNGVARNDWASTLERENNSILYPGASISFIPTAAFEGMKGNVLSYMKLRLGYGSSAGFPGPFNTRSTLGLNSRNLVDVNGNVVSGNTVSNSLGNPDLKPERIGEFEVGLDTKFFDRLNFNVSLYRKTTTDLITDRTLDDATGFDNTQVNVGEIVSEGVEVDYDFDVIRPADTNGFSFNVAGNFTTNETIVTNLAEGTDNILLTQAVIGQAANYAVEGRPFGVLLGTTILRDDNGDKVVGGNGRYLTENNITEIGDPNPDWTTALIPTIRYKNVSFSANINYRHGGDIFSTTAASLIGRGVVDADTPINREANYILPGVLQDGSANNIAITATNLGFHHYFGGPNEVQIFDGSTIRLQEVSIGYSFPKKALDKTPFGSLSFSLSGQNLWYKALNFDSDVRYDTNASSTGVGNGQGIDFITGPSTRRYGFSVKATF